jgi:predicted Zn-dependent protease
MYFSVVFLVYPIDMQMYHAQLIYSRILHSNHISGPPLKIEYNSDVNAHSTWYGLYINTGMLRNVRNDSEMALVIGHELAHYRLGHLQSTPENEYAADRLGASYMVIAGYNICIGAQVVKRFHSKGSKTHPNSDDRYYRLCH